MEICTLQLCARHVAQVARGDAMLACGWERCSGLCRLRGRRRISRRWSGKPWRTWCSASRACAKPRACVDPCRSQRFSNRMKTDSSSFSMKVCADANLLAAFSCTLFAVASSAFIVNRNNIRRQRCVSTTKGMGGDACDVSCATDVHASSAALAAEMCPAEWSRTTASASRWMEHPASESELLKQEVFLRISNSCERSSCWCSFSVTKTTG